MSERRVTLEVGVTVTMDEGFDGDPWEMLHVNVEDGTVSDLWLIDQNEDTDD